MQIQLLSNQVTTQTNKAGKPYQVLEVAYKNLSFNGKVESKKLFDFGAQAESFKTLVTARPTEVFDIDVKKNDAGYNDWIQTKKGVATQTATGAAFHPTTGNSVASASSTKGGWETPEERARKQIYIIRQSSLSTAVNALSVNVKANPKAEEIIELARQFEAYVFESDSAKAIASKDVGTIETMDEDVPY